MVPAPLQTAKYFRFESRAKTLKPFTPASEQKAYSAISDCINAARDFEGSVQTLKATGNAKESVEKDARKVREACELRKKDENPRNNSEKLRKTKET